MNKILPLQLLLKNDHQKLSKNPGIFNFRHFQNFLHGSALHFHSVPPHMDRFPPHFDHFFGQKVDLPLFGELGQTSQDLCGSISNSQKSWDVCLNSSKSGFLDFQTFTLSHSHTLTLSRSHTLTLSHSHTLTLPHSHTLTLSHS